MSVRSVDFANKLHRAGYRLTPQRQLILEAVRKANGHLTPDQVYARVHVQNPAISRATIYRTLDFLCELRLAVALQWAGQTYYEIAGEQPHHHLICRTCGGIEELASSLIDSFVEAVARKQRFTIDMDHIALFGLCERCRAGKSVSSRHASR